MKIKFGMTRTIQTKPYESVKFEVSIEDECEREERNSVFKKIKKFVLEEIEEEEEKWV